MSKLFKRQIRNKSRKRNMISIEVGHGEMNREEYNRLSVNFMV